ncbi:MAG: M23 family metallopeptidase [Fibrobacter sp.]|nr:M23 family metallopeptidase [Fibrobacter sp.]
MKSKFYTIQVIPDDSKGIKTYRLSTRWITLLKIFAVVLFVSAIAVAYCVKKGTGVLSRYENLKIANAQLTKKNENYEELFSRIDSLWVLEERIQNIFETFVENDSNKINSLIEKDKFAHTESEKIEVDFDGIHGWKTPEEHLKLERLPNVVPVIGIISKKFSAEKKHLGTDLAATLGNPVFAAGSGTVEYAGKKEDLGNMVIINHHNGYVTAYSHMKDIRTSKGRSVSKGDVIGTVGMTGNTSGPHLHYTITMNGKEIDPETMFNF